MPTLTLPITASNRDGRATPANGVQLGFTLSGPENSYLFQGASVLKGQTILSAKLQVRLAMGGGLFDWNTQIACEDADNPSPFVEGEPYANWIARPRTPFINWDLPGFTGLIQGSLFESINLATIVQQVVNRPGFVDGIHLFWQQNFESPPTHWCIEQHASTAPVLVVEYAPNSDSSLIALRQGVYNAILAKKVGANFLYNDFELDWSYLPITSLKDFPATGKVWVIGMASDDTPNKSRTNICLKEIPIQIAVQRQMVVSDKVLLDTMITLEEQLRDTVRQAFKGDEPTFQWLRSEAMKDPNGTPFAFQQLRDSGFFEAYFTAYFQQTLV